MIPSTEISAVLFAGGASRRMGRDKANLPWGHPPRPLWQVQLEKLETLAPGEILISARPGQSFGTCEVILDESPGAGPLPALAHCLEAAVSPYLLPLAVDMPAMTTAFLDRLLKTATQRGLVFRGSPFFEPFPALYPRALLPLLHETLAAGHDSLQHFIAAAVDAGALEVAPLSIDDSVLFKSLNTPEDL